MEDPIRAEHLTRSGADPVWLVQYKGKKAVQKSFINPDAFTSFRYEREKFLYDYLSKLDLAPALLAYNDVKRELVVEFIEHEEPECKTSVFGRIPRIMEAAYCLHSLPTGLFPGHFVADRWCAKKRVKIVKKALGEAELTEDEEKRYSTVFNRLVEEVGHESLDWKSPKLLHGDLHPWNALDCADGKVRFIDFGRSRLGDPANDLGYLVYHTSSAFRLPEDETESLTRLCAESYSKECGDLYARTRMFYRMRLVIDLPWFTRQWPMKSPPLRGTAKAMAQSNLERLYKSYQNNE
jgi:hypothetical protein